MADIELVIKLDEEVKNRLCFGVTYAEDIQKICEALNNGTPLDKHDEEVIAETVESIWGKPPYMDMLDKIRAEVEALNQDYYCEGDFDKCKDYVLDILDEYRGE